MSAKWNLIWVALTRFSAALTEIVASKAVSLAEKLSKVDYTTASIWECSLSMIKGVSTASGRALSAVSVASERRAFSCVAVVLMYSSGLGLRRILRSICRPHRSPALRAPANGE